MLGDSRARLTLLLVACAPAVAGCPLPIARTEATSAPVVGSIVWADGTPASGLEVAVSTGYGKTPCSSPLLRATSDAAGMFRLAGTEKHYTTTWFVPNLDRFAPSYRLCATVRDTLRPMYAGYGSLRQFADPDSVTCVVWETADSPRVSCAGRVQHAVVTGGHWIDTAGGGGEGFYRLFLTEEPTRVKGYDKNKPQDRSFVYVQWVEPRAAGAAEGAAPPYRIRAIVSLPYDRNKVWTIQDVRLWRREGRWMAGLEGYKHAFMNDMARTELVFELGPPGQATMVAGP